MASHPSTLARPALCDRGSKAVVGAVGGASWAGQTDVSEHNVGVNRGIAAIQVDDPWLTDKRLTVSQRQDDAVFSGFDAERKASRRVRAGPETLAIFDVDDLDGPAIHWAASFGTTNRPRDRARIRGNQATVDLPRASPAANRQNHQQTQDGPGKS